jgi:hypothetical protein
LRFGVRRGGAFEGLAMKGEGRLVFGRSQRARGSAALLPVVLVAGLSGWTLGAPESANGQSVMDAPPAVGSVQAATPANATPATSTGVAPNSPAPVEAAAPAQAALAEDVPVNGLKISSQSWRRGGLGSQAIITFTLRNDNDYAVKDIEIACAFSRGDGSHLTDRKRVLPDTVDTKSRKTFARLHIGFVNIYANRAKCTPVAARRA